MMKTEYNFKETDNDGIYNLTKTCGDKTILLTGVTLEEVWNAVDKKREEQKEEEYQNS